MDIRRANIINLKVVADAFNSERAKYKKAIEEKKAALNGNFITIGQEEYKEIKKRECDAYNNMMDLRDLGHQISDMTDNEIWFMGADINMDAMVYDTVTEQYI